MNITNKLGLSQVWVDAVTVDDYDKKGWRSVTELVAPMQQQLLMQRHDDVIEEDVVDRIWMLLGSVAHEILQRAARVNDESLIEERFLIECLGKEISLKPDRVEFISETDDEYHLKDFKISTVWSVIFDTKPEWIEQTNLYAYGLRLIGIDITQISVELLCRDWSKSEYERKVQEAHARNQEPDYPPTKVVVIPVEVWDDERCKTFLEQRIKQYLDAEQLDDTALPLRTPEERWLRDEKFAVIKKGAKRSTRNCESRAAAEQYMADKGYTSPTYTIEFRPGRSVRCEDYCSVKHLCRQYREEIAAPTEAF